MTNVASPSTVCSNVAGPVQIWFDTGTGQAMEFYGYSVNGVSIVEQPFMTPIHSDEWGGDAGPPADYQLFGVQHRISIEMQHYDNTKAAKLNKYYNQIALAAASVTAAPGLLMKCAPYTFRMLLLAGTAASPTFVRNYGVCTITSPIDLSPVGSQASRLRLEVESNAKAGAIPWNTDVTTN